MFTEEFNKMITDPAQLAALPLGDIRVIAERYPWCQSAHILLAKKLHLSDSPLFDQQLRKAAMMTFDREQLHQYIHAEVGKPVEMVVNEENNVPQTHETVLLEEVHVEEEVLDIQPEPIPEPIPESIPQPEFTHEEALAEEQEAAELLQEMIESIPEIVTPEPEFIEVDQQEEERIEAEAMLAEENALENLENAIEPITEQVVDIPEIEEPFMFDLPAYDIERELGSLKEEEKFTLPPVPETEEAAANTEVYTDSFEGWLIRLSGKGSGRIVEQKASNAPVRVYLRKKPADNQDPAEHAADKLMNEHIAAELARRSIQLDNGLVSETYARILVMQGKYSKAMEMYQKLSLLKPQKSDYFAALIEQLKKR